MTRRHSAITAERRSGLRRLLRPLLNLGLALVLVAMLFHWFEHKQVYHPTRILDESPRKLGRPYEDVRFESEDGVSLHGWFFPGDTNSARAHKVVLLSHGNGGNISHRLDLYRAMLESGIGLFAYDYRGYGLSQGHPAEEGTYLDAQAAYRWLVSRGYRGGDILSYGESLGGAVAAELCLREKTGGLMLQSTFTSIPDVGAEVFPWLPVRLLGSIRYDTLSKLARIHVPVLVMHSRADSLIRYAHAERNFAAANEPKLFCELSGSHNDCLQNRGAFIAGIERFLELLETTASNAPDRQNAKP